MKNNLIHSFGKEALGKYFLQRGAEFSAEKSYGKAYEFFKEGLDIVTCDCLSDINWLEPYNRFGGNGFPDINFSHTPDFEYYFAKAYIMSFYKGKKNLYIGLDSIEKYLQVIEDDYGFYVKGLIHNSLGEHEAALESFQNGLKYNKNSRLLYRIGRTKEAALNQEGLKYLYNSFLINPSSGCCCRILKVYFNKKDYKLNLINREVNSLTSLFNEKGGEFIFQEQFEKSLQSEIDGDGDICNDDYLQNKFSKFVSDINFNTKLFSVQTVDNDGSHSYDNYGSNYDKYGSYNGWSDEVIDDAFDGDPEATWNVD